MDLSRLTRIIDIGVLMKYILVTYPASAYHRVIGAYIEALSNEDFEEQLSYELRARPEVSLSNNP